MAIKYYNINHETLGAAVSEALRYLVDTKIVLKDEGDIRSKFENGMVYESTLEAHAEISTKKDKPCRAWAHVTIYRRNGTYELTVYVL